jgi:hypothetical protein
MNVQLIEYLTLLIKAYISPPLGDLGGFWGSPDIIL